MNDPFVIAMIALGLSVVASGVRLIDWFIHTDPRNVVRTVRWAGAGLAAASVPLLIVLLVRQQWAAAMVLGAAMLLGIAIWGRRLVPWVGVRPLRPDLGTAAGGRSGFASGDDFVEDPALIRRSAAVLEAYMLRVAQSAALASGENGAERLALEDRTGRRAPAKGDGHDEGSGLGVMSHEEALSVLGLEVGAAEQVICEAHDRIAAKVHPDRGGSHYLALKVEQAKEVLLEAAVGAPVGASPRASKAPRKRARRPRASGRAGSSEQAN
jgi:hypothetical protein